MYPIVKKFEVPVVLIFFNRPQCFAKVFSIVSEIKPSQLFLIQDGARKDYPADIEKVKECRSIAENINWPCEVFQNYSDVNLGCGKRLPTGLTWAFKHVEQAIILEDDCVPDLTFFPYCDELLQIYKNDNRISYVSGLNHFEEWDCGGSSYCFTKTGAISGWATWKRAWSYYDYNMTAIDNLYVRRLVPKQISHVGVAENRMQTWYKARNAQAKRENLSFWDYQWGFVKFSQNALVIVPKRNLIANIGFGPDSTHCMDKCKPFKKYTNFNFIPAHSINLPLVHPKHMLCDTDYDAIYYKVVGGGWWRYAINRFKKVLKRFF